MKWSSLLLVAALTHAGTALAGDDDVKRFSFGLTFGILPDMASLGSTITQDGTVDTADTSMASLIYGTGKALMSDRDNLAIYHNSQHTASPFNMMGAAPELGGPLLGLEVGGTVQYEFDDLIKFPLYLRAGFHYSLRMSGGDQSRTFGDVATENPDIAQLLVANGEDPNDYVGGTMTTSYRADWLEIPITLGIKVPVKKMHYTFAYGGLGVSLFRGGFSVAMDADEHYANVLATHIDTETLTVTNLSPGAVQDTVKFRVGGAGLNWQLGAQAGIAKGLAFFFELNSSGAAKTVLSSELKPETRQLLTATSSGALAAADDEWFKRLAFPVVTSGARVRVGVRYYFF